MVLGSSLKSSSPFMYAKKTLCSSLIFTTTVVHKVIVISSLLLLVLCSGTETWRRATSELPLFTITGRWNLHNPPEICTVTINPRTPTQNPLHLLTDLFTLRERRWRRIVFWNAHLEVYGKNHVLNCTLWKSWAQCDFNKSPGTSAANSQFSVALNFKIERTAVDLRGCICNIKGFGVKS
ncbi:unnamed protein product [Brassica oleracea var. botrytis]